MSPPVSPPPPLTITPGFAPAETQRAAQLYWEAFGQKLGKVLGPETRALGFLCDVLDPDYALIARGTTGEMLGLAGYKTAKGSLVGGSLRDMVAHYGLWGTAWRLPFVALLERSPHGGTLLMDGICVAKDARGQGAGTALLAGIKTQARALGCTGVRLDVIDINPRAKALYEREGFVAVKTETIGPLRHIFGFHAATEMHWTAVRDDASPQG